MTERTSQTLSALFMRDLLWRLEEAYAAQAPPGEFSVFMASRALKSLAICADLHRISMRSDALRFRAGTGTTAGSAAHRPQRPTTSAALTWTPIDFSLYTGP